MSNWFSKLKTTFSNTSQAISDNLKSIFLNKKLDESTLYELKKLLLKSDLGHLCTEKILLELKKYKFKDNEDVDALHYYLANSIANHLNIVDHTFELKNTQLNVILLCGVNGNGKTTITGKLSNMFRLQNKKTLIVAADTFRAAAVDQVKIWAERAKCEIYYDQEKADPASVVFRAHEYALSNNFDIMIIDTAGRLNNHTNLMAELAKIHRVLAKQDPHAPHFNIMVLDSTTGQNAQAQLNDFYEHTTINGMIINKLDGTAKAGVVINLIEKFKLPIYFVGTGESIDDIRYFDAKIFAENLVGIKKI